MASVNGLMDASGSGVPLPLRYSIFKLRLGALRPRSVGRSVGLSVGRSVGRSSKNYKKNYKTLQNITKCYKTLHYKTLK